MTGSLKDNLITLDLILKHPAELKIVIPGNHDLTLDSEYMAASRAPFRSLLSDLQSQNLEQIRELWTGEEAKKHGIVYIEDGMRSFKLSQGTSFSVYASAYTPEFCNWAFAYKRSEDRFSLPQDSIETARNVCQNPVPSAKASPTMDSKSSLTPGVDIMVTHGPPMGMHDLVGGGHRTEEHVGCSLLQRAVRRCRPQLHVFGHIHEGYGATRMVWSDEIGPGDKAGNDANDTALPIETNETFEKCTPRKIDLSRTTNSAKGPLKPGKETLFVNASALTERYKADNHPWVVDLELPISEGIN
ncbi:MAG: hypothetical protein Q9160_004893 [Pyrenula sp. 1 TL-2023]